MMAGMPPTFGSRSARWLSREARSTWPSRGWTMCSRTSAVAFSAVTPGAAAVRTSISWVRTATVAAVRSEISRTTPARSASCRASPDRYRYTVTSSRRAAFSRSRSRAGGSAWAAGRERSSASTGDQLGTAMTGSYADDGPAGGGHRGPGRGHRPPGDGGNGHADRAVAAEQRLHPVRDHPVLRGPGPGLLDRGDARGGQLRRAHPGPARAGRGRGRNRVLELPPHPRVLPAGPGAGGGLHDRAQARGRDLAVRLHPGRGVRGGGLPAWRLQPGHRDRPG